MHARATMLALALVLASLAPVGATAALEAQASARPRVAVIPFENRTDWWGRSLGASAASQLTVGLVNSGAFSVLERQRVDDVYEEWYRMQSGVITPATAVEIGKSLGAQYLITGEFTNFNINNRSLSLAGVSVYESRAESAMNVRMIDVATGEVVAASQATGNSVLGRGGSAPGAPGGVAIDTNTPPNPTIIDRALAPAIEQIVTDLVSHSSRLATTAAPVALPAITGLGDNGSVYIDKGENAGISVGSRFHVLRVVDEIRDRDGNVLDQVTERVGVIEVVRVLSQSAICAVREGSADVNDRLERADGA